MAEIKKLNVGPALTVPLALACRGGQITTDNLEKFKVSEKFSALKEHPMVAKVTTMADMLWTFLGLVLIFHGAQFKNLFLCTQLIKMFCYTRVQTSIMSLYTDVKVAWDKTSEGEDAKPEADAKAEPKPDNKHAQKRKDASKKGEDAKAVQEQREEDAATTKKVLKVLDTEKVSAVVFELLVAFMACHMVMEGGAALKILVAHALVKAFKEKLVAFLDFTGHEDVQAWTDIVLTFVLYSVFGGMAVVSPSLAFALNVAACGAELTTAHGLRLAESKGKIPDGATAEAFAASVKGLAVLGGLIAFGALWQFWALMADSGMAWYFKMMYFPAVFGEAIIGLF